MKGIKYTLANMKITKFTIINVMVEENKSTSLDRHKIEVVTNCHVLSWNVTFCHEMSRFVTDWAFTNDYRRDMIIVVGE